MFIEIIESLRCVAPHEETWLVASIDEIDGRHVVRGALGCPICRERYAIERGIVDMERGSTHADGRDADRMRQGDFYARMTCPAEEDVMRATALLGVTEGTNRYVLCGATGKLERGVTALVDTTVVLLSPTDDVVLRPRMSVVRAGDAVPLAAGSVHGILVDTGLASPAYLAAAARALVSGGRLVAPVASPLPDGMRELARDEREWVAVRESAASAPIALRRR